jgi:phosphoglycolate phosphatase
MLLSKDAKSEYCMYLENDINDAIREFEMNKKLCIFDLDGTLLDTLGGIRKTLNEVLKRNGYATYSVEEVRAKIGDGIKQLIMKSVNADDDVIEKLFHEFLELYKTTHMDDVIIYNGVYELLETLNKEQYKVCILSNKKHVYLEEISETFFKDLYLYAFSEGELPLKPDPTGINKILNLTDTKKDEALFIGDSEVDFKTAKNADVDFIAVSWGNRDKDQLELLGIEQIADNADELYDLIMKN